ncbi:MAG TPA: type VI secretion system ImpA family N-terminal domain-containing protein [Bryobacteraceae bacterium]|nr:type VI secretion system ImpA family N-terminal domain-containing protein [Bryobacteraceae bacterium]
MPTPTVIPVAVLEPISEEKPAGEDLSASTDWVQIRKARPDTFDALDKGEFAREDAADAKWSLLMDLATSALATKSKDLRLAIWITEAAIRQYGFAGVRDGLRMISELLTRYWDSGLYPLVEDSDVESRAGPLEWLNEKMADAIRSIPLTMRAAPAPNYSFQYFFESRRSGGIITAGAWDAAVAATKRADCEALFADFLDAKAELSVFEQLAQSKFGESAPPLSEAKQAFEDCRIVLERILKNKRELEPAENKEVAAADGLAVGRAQGADLSFLRGSDGDIAAGSWGTAEKLAREGNIDQALAQMARLAAAEPNGRVRFQRKLLLAEICLKRGRYTLARSILEELAEQIDKHQLEHWETADVVGAVWTRLYRCYRTGDAADPEKAKPLFERLCRLDPWQALACSDEK